MSLTSEVVFRRTDTGLNESNCTLSCVRLDTQAAVDTTGWTLTHCVDGIYELVVPLATVKSVWSIEDTATGLITAGGTMEPDLLSQDIGNGTGAGVLNERTVRSALRFIRNKWSVVGDTLTVTKENDTDTAWTATVSSDANADPVTGSDPA